VKFKIQAGGEIDVATRSEVREEIEAVKTSWFAEVAKGDRFVRFAGAADIVAGTIDFGEYSYEYIGPREGFVWSVKRIAVTVYDPATDDLALYGGSPSSSTVIIPHMDTLNLFPGNELVLYPGEHLYVGGMVTGPGRVWITGQAREIPLSLAWRL
jgi:hypothetical protein